MLCSTVQGCVMSLALTSRGNQSWIHGRYCVFVCVFPPFSLPPTLLISSTVAGRRLPPMASQCSQALPAGSTFCPRKSLVSLPWSTFLHFLKCDTPRMFLKLQTNVFPHKCRQKVLMLNNSKLILQADFQYFHLIFPYLRCIYKGDNNICIF